MEKRRLLLLALLFLCTALSIRAQWDSSFSQFWAARGHISPSFAGENDAIRLITLYRSPWSGIDNAPKQVLITADMPFTFLGRRHGTGVIAYTETAGTLRNSLVAGQYSFQTKLNRGLLGIGLQAGVYDLAFDAGSRRTASDSLSTHHGGMEVAPVKKRLLDLSTGISWSSEYFFAGLSVQHIHQPRFLAYNDSIHAADPPSSLPDSLTSRIPRAYNLLAGCNIRLFHPLEIQPMVWLHHVSATTRVQAALRVVYNNKYSGGASWKKDEGYAFFAGAVLQGVEVGYAYELYSGGLGKNSQGGHGMYIRYDLPLDSFKPKPRAHKSIRLL